MLQGDENAHTPSKWKCQHVSTIGVCRKIAEVIKWSYDLVTFPTFNPGPTYSLELGVFFLVSDSCDSVGIPSALLLLHDQEVSLASKFPKIRKHHPSFRKKPPVSLSGTPPGRPWTKQETNNSTIQMASRFPKSPNKLHDLMMIVAGLLWNLSGIFCCLMWSSYYDNNPPPQKNSKTEEREEPNNKRRFGSGSWLFSVENAHSFERLDFLSRQTFLGGVSIHHVLGCNWSNIVF